MFGKTTISFILIAVLIFTAFAGCGKAVDNHVDASVSGAASGQLPTTDDFIGEKFAVTIGTIYDQLTQGYFEAKDVAYVESNVEAVEAVRTGKAKVTLINSIIAKDILAESNATDLASITMSDKVPMPEGITNDIAVLFNNQELLSRYNEFLAQIKADGTLDEMKTRWLSGGALPDIMPEIPISGENGTLDIAITGEEVPFDYVGADGEYMGFEVEHMTRFAAYLGKNPVFHAMTFSAVIPYVQSGKADVGASEFNITEERKKNVLFGDPYMQIRYELVFRKADYGITDAAPTTEEVSLDSFKGKKFAVTVGTGFEDLAYDLFETPKEHVLFYEDIGILESVLMGKNDCALVDLTCIIPFLNQVHFKPLTAYAIPSEYCFDEYAAISDKPEYIELFNAFLKTIKTDGTFDDMVLRWVDTFDADNPPAMPEIPTTGENGVLKVATSTVCMPFMFLGANNEIIGLEAEMMTRFAASLGKTVEFIDMSYDALLLYVKSGRCDISAAMYYYSEERNENILFTDAYYDALTAVVYRKDVFGSSTGTSSVSWQDYIGKKFGIMVGSVYDKVADEVFSASEKLYFESVPDEIESVRSGKSDAVLFDEFVWRATSAAEEYGDLHSIPVPLDELVYEYGAFSYDREWVDQYNEWFEKAKADGTYDEMADRWLKNFSYDTVVPEIPTSGENGTLKVAVHTYAPFMFIGKDSKWQGFDIEQFTRFAASLGMNVEFTDMAFAALLPYVASGKADFGASVYITPERAEKVIFTERNAQAATVLVAKKSASISSGEEVQPFNLIEWLKKGVQNNLITENRWKMIVDGLGVTIQISFLSQIFGTLLGALCAYLLTRKSKLPQYAAQFYSGLIHGTPMVVLLMISYYIVFRKSDINPIIIAVAAFTLVEGAVIGGKLHTAISTVDIVEIEAARSMGYSAIRAFFRVTLPQAIKVALPGYLNGFVELVKATAIVGYIAIQDLSRAGDIIRSRTYDAYFPLLFVALIYLIITTLCVRIFKRIIRRLSK